MKLTKADMIAMLESKSDLILGELARYDFLPEDIQKSLYSKGIHIAMILAGNVNLADSIQQLMLNNSNTYSQYDDLKYILAKNPSISSSSQERLLNTADSIILKSLGENPRSNETTLWYIFHKGYIDTIINRLSKLPADLEIALAKELPEKTARRIHISAEAQEMLLRREELDVVVSLASNRHICHVIQVKLSDSEDSAVRCALASNVNLHEDLQDKLIWDEKARYNLALNTNLHDSVIQTLRGLNDPCINALLKIRENRLHH